MKKKLIIKQEGYKECGAASLLSVIRYYGGNVSVNKLVDLTKTNKDGTTFYNIKLAAQEIGLEAVGYKVDNLEMLKEIKCPFICQIIEKHYEHFVVVYKIKKNKMEIMDPAVGSINITIEEFSKVWTNYVMIFNPVKKLLYYKEVKYLNKVILETILKNKSIIFNIFLLSIIFTIISFVYTFYFQIVLDVSVYNNLLVITFVFSLLLIVKCITSFFRNQLLIFLNQKLDYTCILNTFQKVLLLPYSYYKNRPTGEVISRINDLIYVKNILNKIILTVFLDFILFVGSSVILIILNKTMFLILILISLVYILIYYVFKSSLKLYTNINQENSALINTFLIESINGFETVKNLNMENNMKERMEDLYVKALNDSFVYDNISNLEMFFKDLLYLIGILLINFLGFKLVMDKTLTLGILLAFTFLADYFISAIKNIVDLSKDYFYANNAIIRANSLFEFEIESFDNKTNFVINGDIKLNNLFFSYNGEKVILDNINLDIKAKDKVIILGSSGSGKSTILKLLLKYYQVNRNNIYLSGVDINDLSLANLRNNISCVSQNEMIFTDTIRNNIIMYQDIKDEDFLRVCKIACLDEFVSLLFLGYETKLEENGINLSGGQRQRIILARMLLRNSKILLIDEGLNAVDIILERKILKNIFEAYKDNTILVVSHRVENIDLFDQVVKIDSGRVIDNVNRIKEGYSYD